MEPSTRDQPQLRVACLPHSGPYYLIGQAFGRLEPIATAAGLFDARAQMIGIYYDDPATTPAPDLRSAAGILVTSTTPLPPGLTEVTLAAGRFAHIRHIGPYDTLPATWDRMKGGWLAKQNLRRREGPSYEIYVNNPRNAAPEQLLTDIFVPVAPADK